MPLIKSSSYNIDFYILQNNDPKSVAILDMSEYIDQPEKPKVDVILPGFTGHVSVDYVPGSVLIMDSDMLDLTSECDYCDKPDLPDGVYQITMKICPYDELYKRKCFLKTTIFFNSLQEILLQTNLDDNSYQNRQFKNDILDLYLLIHSASADVARCNVQDGVKKYDAAVRLLNQINNKYNC